MPIPRSIHQQWKSRSIPSRYQAWVESWKRYHPTWGHTLWTDESCAQFVRDHYPRYWPLYKSYDADVKRYDAFRYFLMHGLGGLYVDLDFECLQPFDALFESGVTCLLGHEPDLHASRLYGRERLIGNAILASVPGHPFWEHVFEVMASRPEEYVLHATGPLMLQRAYESYAGDDVTTVPCDVFYPLVDFMNKCVGLDQDEIRHFQHMSIVGGFPAESLAVHYWMGSYHWSGLVKRLRRFLAKQRSRFAR